MPGVIFKVQGGPAVGMGHVCRSLCLADTLREYGLEVPLFFCNEDPVSMKYIRERGYRVHPCEPGQPAAGEMLTQCFATSGAEGLVLDQPGSEPALLSNLKASGLHLFAAALDYPDMDESHLDLLVSLYHHPQAAPQANQPAFAEGLAYAIIRPEFEPYILRGKPVRPRARDVLVSFGGGDARGNSALVLDDLPALKNEDYRFHLVIGPNFVGKDILRRKAEEVPSMVRLYESPENVGELMSSCDLGIVGAGTTMMEMAAVGTPSIVLPQNENESRFGGIFADGGAVKMLRGMSARAGGGVAETISRLAADPSERRRMSDAGKSLVDGKGRFRITERIQEGLKGRRCRDFSS